MNAGPSFPVVVPGPRLISIGLLKHHPSLIPALARMWQECLGALGLFEGGIEEIILRYRQELNQTMPCTYVAFCDTALAGSCTIELNGDVRPELSPWLGDLFVDPQYRKQGIGTMLVDTATKMARDQGFEKLYVLALDPLIPQYYTRLGWTKLSQEIWKCRPVTVMEIRL